MGVKVNNAMVRIKDWIINYALMVHVAIKTIVIVLRLRGLPVKIILNMMLVVILVGKICVKRMNLIVNLPVGKNAIVNIGRREIVQMDLLIVST